MMTRTRSRWLMAWIGIMLAAYVEAGWGGSLMVDPLVEVSNQSPFGELANCGNFPGSDGMVFLDSEVEPWVEVNPTNPENIVAFWQQDRWSNGGARGNVAGVSFDGGTTWETVVVSGLTECSGGEFERASDPWISFAPDGTLHQLSLLVDTAVETPFGIRRSAMAASKSTDGGLSWSDPILVVDDSDPFVINDKETITADPTDANLVYAVWDRLTILPGGINSEGPTYFVRTTDGGATWEPARMIYDPGIDNQTLNNQIVVLPDGTLLAFFTEIINNPAMLFRYHLAFVRSTDQGQSWSPVQRVEPIVALGVNTPDEGVPIRAAANLFSVATDRRNGTIYVVWRDARFTALDQIALIASMDQGVTWSTPVLINASPPTPENRRRQQAFLPTVTVTNTGTVGVSYYDFRNDDSTGELTDRWLIQCPMACTDANQWTAETRLTDSPFDYLLAPFARGLFLGDYVGLTAYDDFLAYVPQSSPEDPANGFFRRVSAESGVGIVTSPVALGSKHRAAGSERPTSSVVPDAVPGAEGMRVQMSIAW